MRISGLMIAVVMIGAAPVARADPPESKAADKVAAKAPDCPASYVCAADPASVVNALQAQGYKAALKKGEKTGKPYISSAAGGYTFSIEFNDCVDDAQCRTLGFYASFTNDHGLTPDVVNEWNHEKRFSTLAVDKDGDLSFTYDITTVGGLNQVNFAEAVNWWDTMLGDLDKFFAAHPGKAKK